MLANTIITALGLNPVNADAPTAWPTFAWSNPVVDEDDYAEEYDEYNEEDTDSVDEIVEEEDNEVTSVYLEDPDRRLEGGEWDQQLVVKFSDDGEVRVNLFEMDEHRRLGGCAFKSADDAPLDVVVTGCEGEGQLATIAGLQEGVGSFELMSGEFRRLGTGPDHFGDIELLPPDEDEDARKMRAAAAQPRTSGFSTGKMTVAVELTVDYYYDRTFLNQYNGDHAAAARKIREVHAHSAVRQRHETIGRTVMLELNNRIRFWDSSSEANDPEIVKFRQWLSSQGVCKDTIAMHHLITAVGRDSTAGIAYVGTVCHSGCWNSGITEVSKDNLSFRSLVLSHELGHNLGMRHTFSPAHKGKNCKGYMSYDFDDFMGWSHCSRDDWKNDYDTYVRALGQARADVCFNPRVMQDDLKVTVVNSGTCESNGFYPIYDRDTCAEAARLESYPIGWGPHGGYDDVVNGCSVRSNSQLFLNPPSRCRKGSCKCSHSQPCLCRGTGPQQIKAVHGICLDASERSKPNGKVHMWGCNTSNKNQMWEYNRSTGQIKSTHGLCLDAAGRNTRGGKVLMWPCNIRNSNQHWTYNPATGQIKATHGSKCLDASQRSKSGGLVHMWDCNTSNANQMWKINGLKYDLKKGARCESGYKPLTTSWKDCETAAKALGFTGDSVRHVSYKYNWGSNRPQGCFRSNGNNRFHFNPGTGGRSQGNDMILCVPVNDRRRAEELEASPNTKQVIERLTAALSL